MTIMEADLIDERIEEERAERVRDAAEAGYVDLDEPDSDAPYGRRPDGRPYRMSPEQREAVGRRLAEGRRLAASGVRKVTAPRATKRASGRAGTDYRPAIRSLLQLPVFVLQMGGRVRPALSYDAVAIHLHGPNIAEALNDTAAQDERVARVLDKILAAGPYGALLSAVVPLGIQIMANHGRIPANEEFGILPPARLIEEVEKASA